MLESRIVWLGSCAALLFTMIAGCGGSEEAGIDVKGRLLKGGQPAMMENYQDGYNYYEVFFRPTAEEGRGVSENVAEDGTFNLQRIPPGEYRVGVTKMVYGDEGARDEWNGKFGPENSKLTITVEPKKDVVVEIDEIGGAGGGGS